MYQKELLGYSEAITALSAINDHVTRELTEGKAETACAAAVVDAFGELVALMRMDGAHPFNVSLAIKKAKTAAMTRRDTHQQDEILRNTGWSISQFGDFAVQLPGGVCITEPGVNRGRELGHKGPIVYGAIGCSSRPGTGDEELAFLGLRALQKVVWGRGD